MSATDRSEAQRLLFFDNVRYIVIICVVIFHAAVGYSGATEFFMEATSDWQLWRVRQAVVAFIMPVLFFVSGFFALPSLRGRTYASFLGRKLRRLGIPWLLGVLFLGPLMPYLGYYSQSYNGLDSGGYLSFWLSYMASGFQHWRLAAVFTANLQFHHQHFWFLVALLEIFAVFALAHWAWCRWGRGAHPSGANATGTGPGTRDAAAEGMVAGSPEPAHRRPDAGLLGWLLVLGLLGWLMGLLGLWGGGTYAFFFNISWRLVTGHGAMFALGLYAYHRGWYRANSGPGWRAFAVLSVAWIACHLLEPSVQELRLDSLPPQALWLFWDLWQTIKVGWWLVVLTRLAQRFMNRPSKVNASFAASSYDLYLLQYPMLLAVRLVMLKWDWHAYVKFGIAVAATLVLSYLLSEYLIRRTPRRAVAALVGLHLLMCTVGLPDTESSRLLLDRRGELRTVVPDQRPQRVARQAVQDEDVDGVSYATPLATLARTDSTVLLAFRPGGVHLLRPDDTSAPLNLKTELRDIAVLPTGLIGIVDSTRHLILLDDRTRATATVVDSADSAGALRRLAADGRGGVYAVAGGSAHPDSGRVWHWGPDRGLRPALTTSAFRGPTAVTRQPSSGAVLLAADDDEHIWSAAVGPDGSLAEPEAIAELFMGDSRYASTRPGPVRNTAEDIVCDPAGRCFVATRFGVQVFSAAGRLLGVVTFPDVVPNYQPKEPLSLSLNQAGDRLLVTCGDEVYAVTLIPGG